MRISQYMTRKVLVGHPKDGVRQTFFLMRREGVRHLPVVEDVCEGAMGLMPMIGRARLLRMWGGIMDMSMDGSPIIDATPVENLYLNSGWCYGGFKATPASGMCFAHLLATGTPHPTATAVVQRGHKRGRSESEVSRV